ncbi:retrovirus-related Pol polyprotein from transposon opus [Nephila pilipes]|uniref:Retrovirus-related Pol polyprotein from transposon opus n=1 Tax=Nephila pilipes TaxID=299642 RepID=A0A8X6UJQ4_NEPPI|nr:retrovirus-related Pol polyprotein from transposon opus [Nephila pilipes]
MMGADQVEYVGYLITAEGSCPLPEKVETINTYKMPDTIHEFRTFPGRINFYRRTEAVTEINYDAIVEEQVKDEELKQLMQNNSSLKFKPSTPGKILWCDISTSKIRPYIPPKFRLQMFQLIDGFAPPGVKSTIKLMMEKYVWSIIKKNKLENGPRHGIDAVYELHYRPDVNHTIAQMAYGTCIKLSGEFFDQPTINMDPQNFVTKLQQHMEDIKPLKPSNTSKQGNIYVDRLKPACLLAPDHYNGQTTIEQKNATPNSVNPPLLSDKYPTTSRSRKINQPVRFRE